MHFALAYDSFNNVFLSIFNTFIFLVTTNRIALFVFVPAVIVIIVFFQNSRNFLKTLERSLGRIDIRMVIFATMHVLLIIPISQMLSFFFSNRLVPIASLNSLALTSFIFLLIDVAMLVYTLLPIKNTKIKPSFLNQSLLQFQVDTKSDIFLNSEIANDWLGQKTHFERNHIYYLVRYPNENSYKVEINKNSPKKRQFVFVAEFKNFDYNNRTNSQLLSIQQVLSQVKDYFGYDVKQNIFKEVIFRKVNHIDVHENNIDGQDDHSKNKKGFASRDRIFLEFSTHLLEVTTDQKDLEKAAIKFLEFFDMLLKQSVKLLPVLPGYVVLSQWLQYFDHSPTNSSQNEVILVLTLLDTYLNFSKNKDSSSKDDPNLVAFKQRLTNFSKDDLIKIFDAYYMQEKGSKIENWFNQLLHFSFTEISPLQVMVKQSFSSLGVIPFKSVVSLVFEQKIAIYVLVDYENFELNDQGFNGLFNHSNQDSVAISIEKEPYDRSALNEFKLFRSRALDRYRSVHGPFSRDGMKASDYFSQFIETVKPLLYGNIQKTIVRSHIIKKIKSNENMYINFVDLFFNPQKLDYYYNGNDGFTYRLLYGEITSYLDVHLYLNYGSSYLGFAGFITSPEIIGYLGTFTQDSSLNRYSLTSVYVGQDIQSELPVMVDMSEYRLSNEAVGNSNGHIVVIGKSGSGKTFLTKSLMFQKALEKTLYVFDIENEYNDFSNEKSELYPLLLEKDKKVNRKTKTKTELINQYVDHFDLISTSRVINMFEIHYTDDQKQRIKDNPQNFHEQSQVYQKQRSFLIDFIKDLLNITNNTFDAEIGKCIDETYKNHYKKQHPGSPEKTDFNPNVYVPIIQNASQFPLFSTFKKVVETRLSDIEPFQRSTPAQTRHYEFLYEMNLKASLLLADQYWKDKFNQPSNVKLEKEIIIFNLKSLLNIAGVIPFSKWSLNLLLNFLFVTTFDKELDKKDQNSKGIFMVIDEAHRYLRPELIQMIDFMADISKRGRKRYVEMCLVSQNISDFYRDSDSKDLMQKARDVVKNAAYKFIFQVGSEFNDALKFIEAGFQITETDQTFIRQLYRGQCYFVQGPLELTRVFVNKDPRMLQK